MCAGVSGQIHGASGLAPSRFADRLTATTTATRWSSTSFGSPAVPEVGITIATPGVTGAASARSVSPLGVPHEVRASSIHDRPPLPLGQPVIQWQERDLIEPQPRDQPDPLRAGRQIDHDQFVGSHRPSLPPGTSGRLAQPFERSL